MTDAALTQFIIGCNLRIFFRQICTPKVLDFTKTKVLSQSGPGEINGRYDYGQRSIICLIFFHLPLPLPLLLTYPIILCIKTNHYLQKIRTSFIKNCTTNGFYETCFCNGCFTSTFLINSLMSHVTCHLSGVCIFFKGPVSMELAPLRLYFLVSAGFQII